MWGDLWNLREIAVKVLPISRLSRSLSAGQTLLLFLLDQPPQVHDPHAVLPRRELFSGRQPLRPPTIPLQHELVQTVLDDRQTDRPRQRAGG
jgi:hypothetical protein